MMVRAWPWFVGGLLGLALLASLWPPLLGRTQDEPATDLFVESVRVGQDAGRTRIVLQFAEAARKHDINYRWFTLPSPSRVVVDLGEVSFANSPNLIQFPAGSLVQGMRAGRFRPGTIRMVLDLQKPGRVNVFGIPARDGKGPRMVLDVVTLKKGEVATNVPPPEDVVDAGKAPVLNPQTVEDEPAKVVPPQVVRPVGAGKRDRVVVVLDPGHGGVDPGGCGRELRLCEKNLVLTMAKLVRKNLQSDKIEVLLTRDSDVFIPLPERPRFAQRHNADLFVSLHADIHPTKRDVRGATVYMVSERASDREAQRLANSENAGDVLAGVAIESESREVRNILVSLVQRDTLNNSNYLARAVLDEMGEVTMVRKKEPLFAGFRVLKAPDVPSVLVEMGYLSNPIEERQLANSDFRERLAEGIARGIRRYVQDHVHY